MGRYDAYTEWKEWQCDCVCDDYNQRYFDGEFKDIAIRNQQILEIGFGNGCFLDWATQRGATVYGTEIIDELIKQAQSKGYNAYYGNLENIDELKKETFDLIVAFDVFEHFTLEELLSSLKIFLQRLSPKGKILLRVPNGQSPFGSFYQNGDITHASVLSVSKFQQLGHMLGFDVIQANNSYRVVDQSVKGVLQSARNYLRDFIEISICKTYGIKRTPMDPNITLVLQRKS